MTPDETENLINLKICSYFLIQQFYVLSNEKVFYNPAYFHNQKSVKTFSKANLQKFHKDNIPQKGTHRPCSLMNTDAKSSIK